MDTSKGLGPEEVGSIHYPWIKKGGDVPQMKRVHYTYYEPWDWVIAVSIYEEEYESVISEVKDAISASLFLQFCIGVTSCFLAICIWAFIGHKVSSKIQRICDQISSGANHSTSATRKVFQGNSTLANNSTN